MAEDPYSKYGGSVAASDPYAKYGGSTAEMPTSHTAGRGRTGSRMKGEPEGLPDTFMGTLTKDAASLPAGAYAALRHPLNAAKGVAQSVVELPEDLARDIKEGKYGKISARVLELIIPGLSSDTARTLATEAAGRLDSSAGRAAARISASKLPESIGAEIKSTATPDIVRRIRERLHPKPMSTKPPEPFRPNPNIARKYAMSRPSSPAGASSGMPSGSPRMPMRGRNVGATAQSEKVAATANPTLVKSVEEAAKKAGATESDLASAIAQASAKSIARGGKRLRSLADLSTEELQAMHRELTGPSGPPASLRLRRRKSGQ